MITLLLVLFYIFMWLFTGVFLARRVIIESKARWPSIHGSDDIIFAVGWGFGAATMWPFFLPFGYFFVGAEEHKRDYTKIEKLLRIK